eukprot:Lithocolla_globosa_v1_NODE_885_length_3129_cov_7.608653.p3 type:complete len:101 gc:universal NODE_885_length_3129_cov_7.608653:1996-1694(-)
MFANFSRTEREGKLLSVFPAKICSISTICPAQLWTMSPVNCRLSSLRSDSTCVAPNRAHLTFGNGNKWCPNSSLARIYLSGNPSALAIAISSKLYWWSFR